MKRPNPPQWPVCAVALAVPSPHAAHRLQDQALGNHGLRECLLRDLSHPFAEQLWHLFRSKAPYVLAYCSQKRAHFSSSASKQTPTMFPYLSGGTVSFGVCSCCG